MRLPSSFVSDIDNFRGLFAFVVLIGHAYDLSSQHSQIDYLITFLSPLRALLGFQWVVGFVVLSGFCIELSCKRSSKFHVWTYFLQRSTRIFPLLVVCLVLSAAFEAVMYGSQSRSLTWGSGIDLKHFVLNMVGTGGFFGQFGSFAPAYTISYELLYYFLWAFTRIIVGSRIAIGLVLSFMFVPLFIFLPTTSLDWLPSILRSVFSPFIIMFYIPWLVGAATVTFLDRLVAWQVVRLASRFAWLILAAVMILGWQEFAAPNFAVEWTSFFCYLLLGLAFALVILGAYVKHSERGPSDEKKIYGEISYPLYLAHGPVIVFVAFMIQASGILLPFLSHLVLLMCSAVLVACILTATVERPVMRFRSRLFARLSSKQDAPSRATVEDAIAVP